MKDKIVRWRQDEINCLIENYAAKGSRWCSDFLRRTLASVTCKADDLGLKVSKDSKTERFKARIEHRKLKYIAKECECQENYIESFTPEIVYSLGLLWGDGSLQRSKEGRHYAFLEIVENDFNYIYNTIQSLENLPAKKKWKLYPRQRNETWKKIMGAGLYDRFLGAYLVYYNYHNKSGGSPEKLLNIIPSDLLSYFFRGLFDADGSFDFSSAKNRSHSFTVSSTYDQDWTFLQKYLKTIGIDNTTIHRIINKKGQKYSLIKIYNRKSLNLIFENIYQNFDQDGIGFPRKFSIIKNIYLDPNKQPRNFKTGSLSPYCDDRPVSESDPLESL